MSNILQQLKETTAFICAKYDKQPQIGLVLGSGLANLAEAIEVEAEISYDTIPYFPLATVEGHSGKLIFGRLSGKRVVVMSGRLHFYEGYSPADVAYPIRALKFLGVETLLISNAAGGVNPDFKVGDLMIIKDHISLFTPSPLTGVNEDKIGLRFPDMSEPYSRKLIEKAKTIAAKLAIDVKEGVYFGVRGPAFETRAEYKLIRILGADAVGMSTIQEVITAVHAGLTVFAMSIISNIGIRKESTIVTHKEVLEEASKAEPGLTAIFKELIHEL